jgi:hypothetical protein
LLLLERRVFDDQLLEPVLRKDQLDHGLLAPQGAVIVEGGNAFGGWNEVGRTFLCYFFDKSDDRLLRRSVIPRGKWILGSGSGETGEGNRQQGKRVADGCHDLVWVASWK